MLGNEKKYVDAKLKRSLNGQEEEPLNMIEDEKPRLSWFMFEEDFHTEVDEKEVLDCAS